jgi:putative spermidine/putrescine transport system permease protein
MSSPSSAADRLGLALFALLALAPIAAGLAYAALYSVGLAGLLSHGFTLSAWARVATSAELWSAVALSVFVAVMVALLTTALALPLALALRARLESGWLADVVSLPLAIPGTVAAFLGLQLLAGAGLASRIGYALDLTGGIADFPELVHDRALVGVIAVHTFLAVPFFVLLFVELHRSERVSAFQELAATLGASRRQRLLRVTLPLLLRRAVPALGLLLAVVLGSFEVPLLLGRQSPQMLSVLAYRKYGFFDLAQRPEAFALALGYTLLVLAAALATAVRGARASRA